MLENSIDLSKWEGQRNRAIIEVLFSCGLRVSELVNLKLSNIYKEEQYVRIMGKGAKERLVPISPKALEEIRKWTYDRNLMKIKPGEEDYVFLNRRGAHLTRTMILIMIKRQAMLAGITKTYRGDLQASLADSPIPVWQDRKLPVMASAGIGGKLHMNTNFILSLDVAKGFDPQLSDLMVGMATTYVF